MTARPTTRALVVCDGAAVPPEVRPDEWPERIDLRIGDRDEDVTFVVEHLQDKLGGRLDPVVQDLLAIAAYCFAADREVGRTASVDVHRERWRRRFLLCVPVSDPAVWSDSALTKDLVAALEFATYDEWAFAFDLVDRADPRTTVLWDDRTLMAEPDAVVLFSGGTDSLCAVVDAVARTKARPVLVSHWSAPQVLSRQRLLRSSLRRRFGGWEFPHVPVELHRHGDGDGEPTQRTRGFLFACLGTAVAAHLGIGEVQMPENGYVAVNPRINDQLVGTLASRGTHPKFLQLFNAFVGRVFGGTVRVTNPLWDKTRAEALALLADAGGRALLRQTYSCGKLQGRSAGRSHCGGCSQCVDRRFGAIAAGMADDDPVDRYEFDLFADRVPDGEPRTIALSYLRFAEETAPLTPEAICDARRELDDCVDADAPDGDVRALALADVLRRHGQEALRVMDAMYAAHSHRLTERSIDRDALLLLWQGALPTAAGDRPAASNGACGAAPASKTFGVDSREGASRFERRGTVWFVEFREEKGGLEGHVGARRLARILKAAGQELEALDLFAESGAPGRPRTKAAGEPPARSTRQGDAGVVLTPDDIALYRKTRDDHDRQIRVLRDASKHRKADRLQQERDWLDRELRAWVGKGDRPRAFPEEHERARQTVSTTVRGEYDDLREDMPVLVAHLESFVHLGYLCWYAPDPPERWIVKL